MNERSVKRLLALAIRGPGFVVGTSGGFEIHVGDKIVARSIVGRAEAELLAAAWDLAVMCLDKHREVVRAQGELGEVEQELRDIRARLSSFELQSLTSEIENVG